MDLTIIFGSLVAVGIVAFAFAVSRSPASSRSRTEHGSWFRDHLCDGFHLQLGQAAFIRRHLHR